MQDVDHTPTSARDYAELNVAWGTLLGATLAAATRTGRDAPPVAELPVLGLAAFTVAKTLSKEKVAVWVREPVVEQEPGGDRHPKGSGLRYAVGELVTCSRCLGAWSALAIVGLRALRPREGRLLATVLAAAAVNDLLQAIFAFLCGRANGTDSSSSQRGALGAEPDTAIAEPRRAAGLSPVSAPSA